MTIDPGPPVARLPRWLYAAMITSLAVNLLFIGGVGAAIWHHKRGGGHGADGDMGLMRFARQLPGDRQTLVREQVSAARQSIRPLRRAVRDAWFDTNTALAAEPFNKDAFKAASARQTEAEAKFKTAISDALADTADKLTPQERKLLQEWREKHVPRMLGRHGGRNDGGSGGGPPDGPPDQE